MISIERSSGMSKWVIVGIVAVVLAVLVWWLSGSPEAQQPTASAASEAATPAMADTPVAVSPSEVPVEDAGLGDTTALSQAMSQQPDGQQQLKRVTDFLKFQNEFQRWQELMGTGDASTRAALGQRLLVQLPDHIAKTNMTLPEGEFMCGMIISDMQPNEALRDSEIQACQAKLKAVAPPMQTDVARKRIDCETDYRSREATLVAAFQAMPSSQRDPARLQADLDKAKQDAFADPDCRQ